MYMYLFNEGKAKYSIGSIHEHVLPVVSVSRKKRKKRLLQEFVFSNEPMRLFKMVESF